MNAGGRKPRESKRSRDYERCARGPSFDRLGEEAVFISRGACTCTCARVHKNKKTRGSGLNQAKPSQDLNVTVAYAISYDLTLASARSQEMNRPQQTL